MKKKLMAVTLGAVMACGLLGTAVSASEEKSEVTLWHYYTTQNGENFEAMVEEYNALPEGKAKVTLELIPRNELLKKYTLGVASGDLPDMAIVDNPDTASFAAMGMFQDIGGYLEQWEDGEFMQGPLESGQYDGVQYALPLRSNSLGLWVNQEHFENAGIEKIPETWEELFAVCEQLKSANPDAYPLAFSAVKSEEGVFQFLPFYLSTGATIDTAGSEESVRAFQLLSDLSTNGYISQECINWTQGDVEKQFASGNASMMIGGCWQLSNLEVDAPDMNYAVGNIPKDQEFASVLGGENIGITKAAEDADACWDFLSWILSTDNNVHFNTIGAAISPRANVTPQEQYPDNGIMQKFVEQFSYAVARGPHAKWSEVSGAFQEGMQKVLTGVETPENAAAGIAEKIEKVNESLK